jgi:pimeloyl-ACP methyl ester carboxylesterase
MSAMPAKSGEYRASNGIFCRVVGNGEPLLLRHGLMVSGAMFDPLVELLRDDFRMLIPDLRGHGRSGELSGPYDVPALAADLDAVMAEAGFEQAAVLGYSHGGAVAQQLAHMRPDRVRKMLLACTYAHNVESLREWFEGTVLTALLALFSPATIANLVVRPSKPNPVGALGLTEQQADWLRALMATNHSDPMRGAVRGMITFDSRPWLKEIRAATLVVGGTHDSAVPRHHFDRLVNGIPEACGRLVERAGHPLIWTHTQELADIIRTQW